MSVEEEEFAESLALQFTRGLSSHNPTDGFSALNLAKNGIIHLDGNEADGTYVKDTAENETALFYAVNDFIVNLRIGIKAAGMEIPKHVENAFLNDVEFNDLFVSLVMRNN